MRVRRLTQVYAGVKVDHKSGKVRAFGYLAFSDNGALESSYGDAFIGKLENPDDVEELKRMILKLVEGEPNSGRRYEIDFDKIFLLDKKTFEKMAMKSDRLYAADAEHWRNVRRPLTVYFSPYRSASTGKVRSKHFLVVDIDGKVVDDWTDPRGWVIGFVDKPLTNPRALKLAREFLASNGLSLEKKDRIYRLNPQSMRNKLNQLAVNEAEGPSSQK